MSSTATAIIMCQFGANCAQHKTSCDLKHPANPIDCQWGDKCRFNQKNSCRFLHKPAVAIVTSVVTPITTSVITTPIVEEKPKLTSAQRRRNRQRKTQEALTNPPVTTPLEEFVDKFQTQEVTLSEYTAFLRIDRKEQAKRTATALLADYKVKVGRQAYFQLVNALYNADCDFETALFTVLRENIPMDPSVLNVLKAEQESWFN